MPLLSETSLDGTKLTIKIVGKFDFNMQREFRAAYEDLTNAIDEYDIDLKDTIYLDSSALGMLLVLKEHSGKRDSKVMISNANSTVREILQLANFNRIFEVQ